MLVDALTGNEEHDNQKRHGGYNRRDNHEGHGALEFLLVGKNGSEQKNESKSDHERHGYVKERMHSEEHTGKRHEGYHGNAERRPAARGLERRYRTKGAGNILSMSRGERISGRLRNGVLHGLEVRVYKPRAGDTEKYLCRLIYYRAEKTGYQNKVSLSLVDTPEEYDRHHEEYGLLSQMSYKCEQAVKKRI